jgi:AcrR family transcriptional regulator
MARWEPGARERLQRAALDLYLERGFDDVSVAEITERAGLGRRTFFRYFADKREVLFAGSEHLPAAVAGAVREAEPGVGPLEAALHGLRAAAELVVERVEPAWSRDRRRVIASSPELQERERSKLAACTTALIDALRERDVAEDAARLVAHVSVAVFEVAFTRWLGAAGTTDITRCFDDAVAEVATAFTGAVASDRSASRGAEHRHPRDRP